jgi:hypothetical protein
MEIKISDLMDNVQDDSVPFQIKNIVSSDKIKEATMKKINETTNIKHYTRKASRVLLIAAVIVMVISSAAFAIYQFSLKDLEGPVVQIGAEEVHTISLNGLKGSPEYEAAQKWEIYVNERYKEGQNMLSPGYVDDGSDMYLYCNAFSQEAKDTLDDILDEYGLNMHNTHSDVKSFDELYTELGINGFMQAIGSSGEFPVGGTFYDDGSFSFNCATTLPDGSDARYQFYRLVKGSFTRIGNLWADAGDYEEWAYTTASGETVLLAISANLSIMAVNFENCFVFVNILSGTENSDESRTSYGAHPVDRSDLEAFADSFDIVALSAQS